MYLVFSVCKFVRIVDTYKSAESEDWQGLTGSIPESITTWTQLHSLYTASFLGVDMMPFICVRYIEDQDLQGQLPMKLSSYYMPELNTL